jgi:hypothetical protein
LTALKAPFAAEIVFWRSSSVWVALRKAASNCEGGRKMLESSIARKKRAKAAVSDFEADSQSVTVSGVKNHVNIEPTRLKERGTPASFAAAATPSTSLALRASSLG